MTTLTAVRATASATLLLDLAGQSGLRLRFYARDYGDETDTLPQTFTGLPAGDGVAISENGTNWYRAVQLGPQLTSTYAPIEIDLDAVVNAAGMSYNSNFQIRWIWSDDFAIATDGIAIDSIAVGRTLPDVVPPTGTVSIDAGATRTTTSAVVLTVTATDTSGAPLVMSFSNDGTTWSPWETFTTTRSWSLTDASFGGTAGVGTKTVRARYRDAAQNVSTTVSDTINYDPPPAPGPFPLIEDWESG